MIEILDSESPFILMLKYTDEEPENEEILLINLTKLKSIEIGYYRSPIRVIEGDTTLLLNKEFITQSDINHILAKFGNCLARMYEKSPSSSNYY